MSYEGTYGPSETCPHDCYWRSCAYCSTIGPHPTSEQIAKARALQTERKAKYLAHPHLARETEINSRTVIVYEAVCPAECGWARNWSSTREWVEKELQDHIEDCDRVAAQWVNVDPNEAYVAP